MVDKILWDKRAYHSKGQTFHKQALYLEKSQDLIHDHKEKKTNLNQQEVHVRLHDAKVILALNGFTAVT